jgi:hypothetical protein
MSLWEAGGGGKGGGKADLVVQTCRGLRVYARVFPIGEPRALEFEGRRRWVAGSRARARSAWRRSLAAAERLDMPYDQGRAHTLLGRHSPPGSDERARHLARAAELFDDLGASWDLAEVRRFEES